MADQVWLKILHSQFVNVCEEMAHAMIRTSYSPIFSEGLDFSTMVLDVNGDLVAMANMNPAMLGQSLFAGRWVIDELGAEQFQPGDVVIHNDPYRGGSHMPEHLLVSPFFHDGVLRGFVGNVAHVAEIGGMAPGSFASNATEIYQEGLRLPPVKIVVGGEPVQDVWRIVLANHRTPESSWGDFNAMIGSLNVGMRRLGELFDEHGAESILEGVPQLYDYAEKWIRREISELPDGRYGAEDSQEDDGFSDRAYTIRVEVTVEGDRHGRGLQRERRAGDRTDQRALSGDRVGELQRDLLRDRRRGADQRRRRTSDRHHRAGRNDRERAPSGPCVGGQTELQPRLIDLVQGLVLSQLTPERSAAACGGTGCNFLFGGFHPRTGSLLHALQLRGDRLGRSRGQRRKQRRLRAQRQLSEHAGRGLRDTLSVASRRVPSEPRRWWRGACLVAGLASRA